jgi:ABC-2 type transport system ATP-binding protein
VRSLIRSFAADGTTVFVSSHLLAEVEQLCTHVGVMSAGRLVAQGTLEEFRRSGESRVEVLTPDPGRARAVLARLGLVTDAAALAADAGADAVVTALLADHSPAPDAIVAALVGDDVRVHGFAVRRTSLEQRFVELTGEGFDVVA